MENEPEMLEDFLEKVARRQDLSVDEMQMAITWMLAGRIDNDQIKALLLFSN